MPNGTPVDAVLRGDVGVSANRSANLADLLGRQAGPSVALQSVDDGAPVCFAVSCATLGYLVVEVVFIGAKEQMLGIDAASVVAPMQDVHPLVDGTAPRLPRQTMSRNDSLRI